ncbi:MAG: D-cysteine desulfhydrase family protein [Deltaproteobacteria bacterium]|nr:D-cysteine desulfhydrase family protein [Deltaproteobacteria bacterium]
MVAEAQISYPPRIELARTPTPLQPLTRLSREFGVELFIKRDDLTGVALSGNKVRKLEFVLADAVQKGADVVLTCGGAQSNHCRATAVAATRLGLKCRLLLRTPDPGNPPSLSANSLLDWLVNAEIVWITPEEYRRREEIFAREVESLRLVGRKPYIIPEGASNPLGTWGYIRAMEELARDLAELPGGLSPETTIFHASGSGGTAAGVILGAKLHALPCRLVSVNVCDDRDYFVRIIGEMCEKAIKEYRLPISFSRSKDVEIIDGYVGRGYSLTQPPELEFLVHVARTEGIILDPVYTGKAMYGLCQELKARPGCFGDRIVFIHTGGIFGLFPYAAELTALS